MTEKTDYFHTFCRVSKAFGTTLGKQELLDLICRSAVETVNGKAACLFLADEEQDVFVPVAQKGLSEDYLHAKPMRAKEVVANVLRGGHLSVWDATTDPRLENHEAKRVEGIASILVVPVMVMDKPIGVLSLYTAQPRQFTEDEVSFLAALAEQGGMAIRHARLVERIQRNSRLFYEFASNLSSSLDIKQVLQVMTAGMANAFGMKGVVVRLLNKDTGTLDLVAGYGLSQAFLNKGPVTQDICTTRALQGETLAVRTRERPLYREETEKEGIAATLCVPIKVGDEAIGLMELCSGTDREFSEDLIQLVNALGHQGGLAIQNASLYLMLQEDKKDLEKDIWGHKSWF